MARKIHSAQGEVTMEKDAAGPPTTREARTLGWSDERVAGFLALGILLLLTLAARGQDLLPSPARMAVVLAWPIATLAYVVSGRLSIVTAFSVIAGFQLRWVDFFPGGGSDVLPVTSEAIATTLRGGNPYAHLYLAERPVGSLFPYPPGEMLLHLPGYLLGGLPGVRFTEVAASLLVMAVFVWLARRVSPLTAIPALALYAALPNLINLSTDAGNDTSSGCMLLLAVLALLWSTDRGSGRRSLAIAAVSAGFAVSTKQTAVFVVLMLGVFVWDRYGRWAALRFGAVAALTFACLALPFLVMGPGQFVHQMIVAPSVHGDLYGWNIWVFAQMMGWPVLGGSSAMLLEFAAIAFVSVLMLGARYTRLSLAVVAGVVITMVALLTARWTTYSYFADVAPLVLLLPTLFRHEAVADAGPIAVRAPIALR